MQLKKKGRTVATNLSFEENDITVFRKLASNVNKYVILKKEP